MKIVMLILAAGCSQQTGVFKPLLPVGETSALCRAVCLGIQEKIHMISVVTGYHHDEVITELSNCQAKNVRHIYNAKYADGTFSSIKAGIRSLPRDTDGILLMPIDQCTIGSDTLDKLIASFILSGSRTVVYPTYHGVRGYPLLIPYCVTGDIYNYTGHEGLLGYLSQFPSVDVEIDDPCLLYGMDTPHDLTS